ncbi:hypothetical protein EV192_110122 [Actinocrispum wychmicini]|uniref:PknH-like protein n=1 Tax=Actinocrispum wychmicini TaxID=1213861 RepID=A0A4R2J4D8_9PSEU|nr:hypothetical protein EV192_110122 [Actinocrispum wychmicini]
MLATAGAALLLASCSNRPNDLRDNRYYKDVDTPATSASVEPPAVRPAPMPAAKLSEPPKPRDLAEFALTAADLATEGVQRTGTADTSTLARLPDCDVSLGSARAGYQTTWTYPTGATVRQYVAEFDGPADRVVAAVYDGLKCGKYKEMTVRKPVMAADGQVSWCATSTKQDICTAVKADGQRLSVVSVTAATEIKAQQAVTRIAPLAATALERNS